MWDVRRSLACCLVAAVGLLASAPCSADWTIAARDTSASVVIVSSTIAPHRDAIGAGVVVALEPARLRVLTARHVADRGAVTIWVHGKPLPAEIVRTFLDRDLAVIDAFGAHLDRLKLRPAEVGQAVSAGGELFVWGENEQGLRIVQATLVSPNFQAPDTDKAVTLLSIACDECAPGDSGGGVFNSAGRLLGILSARYYTRDDRTVAIVAEPVDPSMYAVTDNPVVFTGRPPAVP